MFTECAAIVPNVLVSEYLQTSTPVGSDEIAWSYGQITGSHSVRNTIARLAGEGHIFQPYVFFCGIFPDRDCRHYVESLPKTPYISFKVRTCSGRDLAQTELDIGAWSKSCAVTWLTRLKCMEYAGPIGRVRHLSALINQMVLGIQGKSAE